MAKFTPTTFGVTFLLWRGLLTLIVLAGLQWLPFTPTFPYAHNVLPLYGPRSLTTWAHFDGVHYLNIARKGYDALLSQAFFPGYPLLVRGLSAGVINPILVGVVASTVFSGAGLYLLYRLVMLDETETDAKKVLALSLLFPTAFYFTAMYNEGLFLLLTVLCFYGMRQKQWGWAGLAGAAAAATRLVGVYLVFALIYEYIMTPKTSRGKWGWIGCLLPLMGLGIYMLYLGITFHDPLLFYHVQSAFGAARETGTIVLPPQVIYRYLRMLVTVPLTNPVYYTSLMELVTALGGWGLLIAGWYKTRRSYVIYATLAFITPMLTGNFSSLSRYALPLFPLFIVLAKSLKPKAFYVVCLIFAILLIVNLLRFTQGRWVA